MNYIPVLLGQIYANVVPFVILLGILIFVHELGHFLVARMCGVRVEVFSLGFGKKIFSFKRGDTTYCLSLIPLGGYVKMFGEQGATDVPDHERSVSFTHKTVWQRIAIVLAGPLMNFFFAVFVFFLISHLGEETRSPVVAEVTMNSPAQKMGFQAGDRVLTIGSQSIQSYEDFQRALTKNKNSTTTANVETASGQKKTLNLEIASIANPNIFSIEKSIGSIEGIQPLALGALVGVLADSPAAKLGFKTGDEIVSINDKKVNSWNELDPWFAKKEKSIVKVDRVTTDEIKTSVTIVVTAENLAKISTLKDFGFEPTDLYLDQIVKGSPAEQADLKHFDKILAINQKPMQKWEDVLNSVKSFDGKDSLLFSVLREGTVVTKKITPQVTSQMTALGQDDKRYTIGIVPLVQFAQPEMTVVQSPSVFHSLAKGFSRTWDISAMTVVSFVKLFQGEVSHKNIGGMISIGKAAKDSFALGLQSFLMTMGILSVSLFILNLLPIPVLDGGHLVFYTIEVIKGSPLSVKKMEMAQQVGFVLLMGLMVLALFNDFTKFFFKS
ncbi:MAG: RIP metalloprotease RseP [Bdellovibrionaceae bacterium]|nr:RIP metalloprotease RseP [Bdellovibrio sp.]